MAKWSECETDHAFLVAWGDYADQTGLVAAVLDVPLPQKLVRHSPQEKVLEFLVAILAGLEHLEELTWAAHPLVKDRAVAQAWHQVSFADHSGVHRTLHALQEGHVDALIAALEAYQQRYLQAEIQQILENETHLIVDGDLTGLPVSRGSHTYPDAAFGYMDGEVRLGYQAALVSLTSDTVGRRWLSVTHHPGNTVSCTEAQALAEAAEACLHVRPRRRTELVQQRLTQLADELALTTTRHTAQIRLEQQAAAALAEAHAELTRRQAHLGTLETQYQELGRVARPCSQLERARSRVTVLEQRCHVRERHLATAQGRLVKTTALLQERQAAEQQLRARLAALEHDNATNLHPVPILMRLDAGFGTYPNIALLIELGYEVFTRAKNQKVAQALRRRITEETIWTPVGTNADMVGWSQVDCKHAPYPLDAAVERFHLEKPEYTVLLHYGDLPVVSDLPQWFAIYNHRQTIEAAIKEGKQVFQMHHFKVRTTPAMRLQEYLVGFAANFIRRANQCLQAHQPVGRTDTLDLAKIGTKTTVRVGAHTSAQVTATPTSYMLRFSERSCYAGKSLTLPAWAHQQALPGVASCVAMPLSTIT